MKKRILALFLVLILVFSTLCGCELLDSFMSGVENGGSENGGSEGGESGGENGGSEGSGESGGESPEVPSVGDLGSVPPFDGTRKYIIINDNVPFFEDEKRDGSYESFSELDSLGRCGVAIACIGRDLMPTEDRDDIGHVRPSGWHSVEYDVVPGGNLYNRCHLIGFQLTGENDNEKNLITGTRDMNNEAMLPFENKIANYVRNTGNHVLYRVTPIFEGANLVANGVLMEALSVEDNGEGIKFCIYAYHAQRGIAIDYRTGESRLADDPLNEILGEGHDERDILPAAAPDSVSAIYEEYVGDEFSGCVVVVVKEGFAANIILAVDIDEEGRVAAIYTVSDHETHGKGELTSLMGSFVGDKIGETDDNPLVSGATVSSGAIKAAVDDALLAFAAVVDANENGTVYIANKNSKKFHEEGCSGAASTAEHNKLYYVGFVEDLTEAEYTPCGICKP